MPAPGPTLRLRRILRDGRTVIVPMDHGVSSGPVRGLEDAAAAVDRARAGGANAVVVHKGLVEAIAPALGELGLILHLSASTSINPDPNDKRIVCTVDEAARIGADAVSVHVNIGAPTESRMVEDLGRITREAHELGLPVLAMMYPRGPTIDDPHDVDLVKHVARLGAELGADLIKCPYTGSAESFATVTRSCPAPVVISGGARMGSEHEVLAMVADSLAAGGAGVSIGRNAFQADDPTATISRIARLVLDRAELTEVLEGSDAPRGTP